MRAATQSCWSWRPSRRWAGTFLAKDEGHRFAKKNNQDHLQAVEVLFLTRHLIGNEPRS
jgi:hypothetical protein